MGEDLPIVLGESDVVCQLAWGKNRGYGYLRLPVSFVVFSVFKS